MEEWGIYSHEHAWYSGSKYLFQGEPYPVTGSKQEVKRYTSKKRAENAIKALDKTLVWDYNWEVKKL